MDRALREGVPVIFFRHDVGWVLVWAVTRDVRLKRSRSSMTGTSFITIVVTPLCSCMMLGRSALLLYGRTHRPALRAVFRRIGRC